MTSLVGLQFAAIDSLNDNNSLEVAGAGVYALDGQYGPKDGSKTCT